MTGTPATRTATQCWTAVLDGSRLRHLRRQRGLSQEQLADRAGISPAAVAGLERQPTAPCHSCTLSRLASAPGEDPAHLTLATKP
jgi:DNA-binding XRE family transcriptional regulator